MHRFPDIPPEVPLEKQPISDQAEFAAYRNPDGQLYIPSIGVQRSLISSATYSKGKGRASLQKPVAACVLVSPEYLVIDQQEYRIDSRPVVVPATKGRVMRHRPRFDEWSVSMEIEYDETLLTVAQLRIIVDDAGSRVGLLDFRPECKGPFGRFFVTRWEV